MSEHRYVSPDREHNRFAFYKYMTARVAKIVLTTRKLRWSSPLLFDDPFDVMQELRLNFDGPALQTALTERVALLIEQGDSGVTLRDPMAAALLRTTAGASPDSRRAMANELRQRMAASMSGQTQSLADLKALWMKMVPTFRILCLSELNDITPMWLHYADAYKGVLLEFCAVDEVDSAFLVARPVIYQDAPPSVADLDTWVDCLLNQDLPRFLSLFFEYQYSKTNAWSYQKEWRIASASRPGETGLAGEYGFHPRELIGIYFGPMCSAEDRTDLCALLSYGLEHVHPHEAVLDIQSGKFTFRGIGR
jgi:hypothetical protein